MKNTDSYKRTMPLLFPQQNCYCSSAALSLKLCTGRRKKYLAAKIFNYILIQPYFKYCFVIFPRYYKS